MQFRLEPGSTTAAFGLAGGGVALAFPAQRWLGFVMIALAVVVFLFDIRVEHAEVDSGERRLGKLLHWRGFANWKLRSRTFSIMLAVVAGLLPGVFVYFALHFVWIEAAQYATYGTIFSESKDNVISAPPQVLMDFYRGRITSEGDELIAPYKGKWMKISAVVEDIQNDHGSGEITVFTKDKFVLHFKEIWEERLDILQRGEFLFWGDFFMRLK